MAENALTFDNLLAVLKEYGTAAQDIYKRKLTDGGKNASFDLLNSVKWDVKVDGRRYDVTLELAKYWKYVEGGAQGGFTSPQGAVYPPHWPPVNAILDWITIKPVIPYPDKRGRIPSPNSLAFLIGRKIARHGIKPFPALAETIEELNDIYRPRIAEAVTKDVSAFIPILFSSLNVGDRLRKDRR